MSAAVEVPGTRTGGSESGVGLAVLRLDILTILCCLAQLVVIGSYNVTGDFSLHTGYSIGVGRL